jgi:large subunit ribosomal protein L9
VIANSLAKGAIRTGASIPVILLEDVDNQGVAGEVVRVKRGYARNFLVPKRKAVYMSDLNKSKHVDLMASAANKESSAASAKKAMNEAKNQTLEALMQMQGPVVTIQENAVADTGGKLYGSVTASSIAAALDARGVSVTASQISVEKIDAVGVHKISILGEEFEVEVTSES